MLALTLAAILLLGMKAHGHTVTGEGTVIGTALGVSIGYWISLSGISYTLCPIILSYLVSVVL